MSSITRFPNPHFMRTCVNVYLCVSVCMSVYKCVCVRIYVHVCAHVNMPYICK